MRITEKVLRSFVEHINIRLSDPKKISIEWAYGQPRIYANGGSMELSHKLPTGEMYEWLLGFSEGLDYLK